MELHIYRQAAFIFLKQPITKISNAIGKLSWEANILLNWQVCRDNNIIIDRLQLLWKFKIDC